MYIYKLLSIFYMYNTSLPCNVNMANYVRSYFSPAVLQKYSDKKNRNGKENPTAKTSATCKRFYCNKLKPSYSASKL